MHVHLMIVDHGDYEHWDTTYRRRFRSEIMPAAAKQLLSSGVTFARELGAPLEDILDVRRRIEKGEIPGPRLFVSGPFIQHRPYFDYEKEFRWGVAGAADGNFHTDSTWRELATWVELGMTPMQAIAGATRWPAAWL